jgi:hypothetical protein
MVVQYIGFVEKIQQMMKNINNIEMINAESPTKTC